MDLQSKVAQRDGGTRLRSFFFSGVYSKVNRSVLGCAFFFKGTLHVGILTVEGGKLNASPMSIELYSIQRKKMRIQEEFIDSTNVM